VPTPLSMRPCAAQCRRSGSVHIDVAENTRNECEEEHRIGLKLDRNCLGKLVSGGMYSLPLLRLVWVAGFSPAPATPSEGHLRTHFIKPVVVPVGLVGERPESVGNLWAAPALGSPTTRAVGGAVHGLSTRPAGLGPVRRTRPQVHRQIGWGYHHESDLVVHRRAGPAGALGRG
jgi:hypothetical protein